MQKKKGRMNIRDLFDDTPPPDESWEGKLIALILAFTMAGVIGVAIGGCMSMWEM